MSIYSGKYRCPFCGGTELEIAGDQVWMTEVRIHNGKPQAPSAIEAIGGLKVKHILCTFCNAEDTELKDWRA